jgi:hypothetical protein
LIDFKNKPHDRLLRIFYYSYLGLNKKNKQIEKKKEEILEGKEYDNK